MALATLDDVAAALGVAVADVPAGAQAALDAAVAGATAYLGWDIEQGQGRKATVRGDGTQVLYLPALAVSAVASITDVTDGASDLVAAGTYRWWAEGVVIRVSGPCHWAKWRSYEVVFDGGYAAVPPAITSALAGHVVRSLSIPTGVRSELIGSYSVLFAGNNDAGAAGITPDAKRLLDPYRLSGGTYE